MRTALFVLRTEYIQHALKQRAHPLLILVNCTEVYIESVNCYVPCTLHTFRKENRQGLKVIESSGF